MNTEKYDFSHTQNFNFFRNYLLKFIKLNQKKFYGDFISVFT